MTLETEDEGGAMNARRIVPSVAAMLALLIVGVTAPAANAATGNCAAGYICVWRDHDYKTAGADGTLVRLYYYIPDLSAWQYKVSDGAGANSGIAADDSVTSIYNHGNTELARYYKDSYGNGSYFILTAGSVRNNLATSLSPSGYNDSISSIYFASYDPNF